MIDWETIIFPCHHEELISGGLILSCDSSGEVEWQSQKRLSVEGSHSSTIQVKTYDLHGGLIWVSGNPSKFLQGHNLFGTDDLLGLNCLFFDELTKAMGLSPTPWDWKRVQQGMYDLKRVDATGMLALPSQQDVVRFIHAATPVVRGRHQGVSAYGGETIYLGQKSRRITTKLYNKFLELKKHPLPTDIPSHDDLMRYAENRLRVEVCIRSQELKDRGLSTAANWNSETASTLVAERLKNMNLPEKMKLPDKTLKALPGSLAGAYALWMDGHDLREIYPKRTFYRYRSGLLAHGIDITASRPKSSTADVIPMVRYLFADFRGTAEVPQFARGTTLYADPSTFRRRAA